MLSLLLLYYAMLGGPFPSLVSSLLGSLTHNNSSSSSSSSSSSNNNNDNNPVFSKQKQRGGGPQGTRWHHQVCHNGGSITETSSCSSAVGDGEADPAPVATPPTGTGTRRSSQQPAATASGAAGQAAGAGGPGGARGAPGHKASKQPEAPRAAVVGPVKRRLGGREGFGASSSRAGKGKSGSSLARFDRAFAFPDLGDESEDVELPSAQCELSRIEVGEAVDEPVLMLGVVLAGACRRLSRPAFQGRDFVSFGAEASKQGTRMGQPRYSVAFAPLNSTLGAASEVWVDQAVSDVRWMSRKAVVVAAGSSLLVCGPPRPNEGVEVGSMSTVGSVKGKVVELAVDSHASGRVACAVEGGVVALATVTDGEAIQPSPVLVKTEDDLVGSVRWESEDAHCFSYTVTSGVLVHVDIRQPFDSPAARMPCFQGAFTHAHVAGGNVDVVAGEGGRVSFYDRRFGRSMADLRDPLLSTIGDIHAHPTNGRFALLGYPGFTSWDIARISYGGAQGLSHSLVSAKRVSGQPKGYQTPGPCDGVENQPVVGTAGAGDAGAGVKRPASSSANQEFLVARGPFAGAAGGGAPPDEMCMGSLLSSMKDEMLLGMVTAAPTSVVQIYRV